MDLANGHSKLRELETVITDYQDQLFRFAFYRTGSYADSQDIVQDVFVKMFREYNRLSAVHNIKRYLFRSITNACSDFHRQSKKGRYESIETASIPSHMNEKEVLQSIIQVEDYERLKGLLANLPEEQQEVIRMRITDCLSFVEIADVLEIPVTTVKSRFKYGIDKLKVEFATTKEVNYGM